MVREPSRRSVLAGTAGFLLLPFFGLLALVEARWGPLRHLDLATTNTANAFVLHHRLLVGPLRASDDVLHPWVFRVVVVVLAIWVAARGMRRLAAWALVAILIAAILDPVLKTVIGRPRPVPPHPIAHAWGAAFPSGHALAAVVGGAVIVVLLLPVLRGVWRIVAWAAAAVVGVVAAACRVLLGVHYVSDVLASWLLGAAILLAVTAALLTPSRTAAPERCRQHRS